MTSSTAKDGMYFDGDTGMAAAALIDMFGDDAPVRVGERVEDMRRKGNEDALRFWQAVASKISQRLAAEKK